MTLVGFVRARIDDSWVLRRDAHWYSCPIREGAQRSCTCSGPLGVGNRRALVAVEAQRRLVDVALAHGVRIDGEWACCHSADELAAERSDDVPELVIDLSPSSCAGVAAAWEVLTLLAWPFSDHSDYLPSWTPSTQP